MSQNLEAPFHQADSVVRRPRESGDPESCPREGGGQATWRWPLGPRFRGDDDVGKCRFHLLATCSSSLGAAAALALLSGGAYAQSAGPDLDQLFHSLEAQKAALTTQEQQLKQQMQELGQQKAALRQQQEQLDALRTQFEQALKTAAPADAAVRRVPPSTLEQLRGTGQPSADVAQAQQQPGAGAPQQPVGQAPPPQERPQVDVLADRGGVLTPKGAIVYEPALDFSHTTDSRAIISGFTVLPSILVGNLDITRVNHDVLQAVNTFRVGLTNRAELELRVPYVYGRQETTARPLNTGSSSDTTSTATGLGIGDVEAALHYQVNNGGPDIPYFIGNLRFKSRTGTDPFEVGVNANGLENKDPTGSGFYNIEPSLTAIYPSDPAVFFANVGYLVQLGRTINSPLVSAAGPAQVDPGDAIRFSFGLGFGINEASSFSLGYDYTAFFQTKINHQSQQGTDLQIGSVLIGYSYRFSDRFSANVTTFIGVTSDAPNTRIILRFPIQFQVFN
jgi:hypothetical protein